MVRFRRPLLLRSKAPRPPGAPTRRLIAARLASDLQILSAYDAAPIPWKNGAGLTRVLLTWPAPESWILRLSIAEIHQSGPFSIFPGIERWFAVLSGGAVALETQGGAATHFDRSERSLHRFRGDAPTNCTISGAPTQDFNVMLDRARGELAQRPLAESADLETTADWVGLFTVAPLELSIESDGAATGAVIPIPALSLAAWPNPARAARRLRIASRPVPSPRGWWLECIVAQHHLRET